MEDVPFRAIAPLDRVTCAIQADVSSSLTNPTDAVRCWNITGHAALFRPYTDGYAAGWAPPCN